MSIAVNVHADDRTTLDVNLIGHTASVRIGNPGGAVTVQSYDAFHLRRIAVALNQAADSLDLLAVAESPVGA